MKQIKRTNISIETREVLVIRNGVPPPEVHCPNCGSEIEILTPEQASARGVSLSPQAPLLPEGKNNPTVPNNTTLINIQEEK